MSRRSPGHGGGPAAGPGAGADRLPYPLVLGHRGFPGEALENTLPSLARALEAGADGVEIDVQRSRDGVPVVVHDPTLTRTLGVRVTVAEHAWPALQRRTGGRLPSLEQVCAWAAASGAWLNVELKAAGVEAATAAALGAADLLERTFVSSFDASILAALHAAAPDVRRFLLCNRWDAAAEADLHRAGAAGVCLRVDAATPAALARLAEAGLPLVVWTVNQPARVRELLQAGVAAIISDDPRMAALERARGPNRSPAG